MKLVLLFGPQAVGKMTIGQELAKITDLKLFHNHNTKLNADEVAAIIKERFKL